MSASDLPPLRDVIRALQLTARKSLGQNFILDLNLTGRIARLAGPLGDVTVVEIGPGPGGLTRALLSEGARNIVAIERDARFLPALQAIADANLGRLTLLNQDALEIDFPALVGAGPAVIVANLPYNIATLLLVGWLEIEPWPPWWQKMTLMFQREVAERIVSQPGSKSYGRLSVLAQWRSVARIRMNLPAQAFTPPPKVDSCLVEFTPKPGPPSGPVTTKPLAQVTAAAFGQRRKMLRSSLARLCADPEGLLRAIDIDPEMRAEQLSVGQFCQIAAQIEGLSAVTS